MPLPAPPFAAHPTPVRAFSTLGCPQLDLPGAIALAERFGLPAIELRALSGTIDLPGALGRAFGEPARLTDALRGCTVRVAAFGASLRLLAPSADDRAALLAYVPWAEAAGAPLLRVFDGGEAADAAECRRARDTLAWWAELRGERGWAVDLVVETHDALVTPIALARFLDQVPAARLLWDSHHTWRHGGTNPADTWAVVRDRTGHIHVKDSALMADGSFRYVLPGDGAFPMDSLRHALAKTGYRGVISLEWERMWHAELPPLAEALQEAADRGWW